MQLVDQLYLWTDFVLFVGLTALRIWAIADCLFRKRAAFPAADKLTKPAWVTILIVAGFLGSFLGRWYSPSGVLSIFSLISAVVALVYLADVRPAVRDIADGR